MDAKHRRAMFDALKGHGVLKVEIQFNGSGDSGQIDDVHVEGLAHPEEFMKLPIPAELHAAWGLPENTVGSKSWKDYLEDAMYDVLNETDYDWVNNDGGFGTLTILPAVESLLIDMNIRVTEVIEYTFGMLPDGRIADEEEVEEEHSG